MKKNSRIYIAGHTGFLGSFVLQLLRDRGYTNLIFKSRRQLDLTDQFKTDQFFKKYKPEYVFLFAAKVGGIYANSTYPAEFIFDNTAIQTNVIHSAYKYGVKKLLFPGSACMYPKFCPQPMNETHILTGKIESTNEPFGVAKICGVKMCESYNRQYKTKFICMVPATVYGPGDHFNENGHVVAGLMQRFYEAGKNKDAQLGIWGTGKPKREFIYVTDTAEAAVFLMKKYNGNTVINAGSGEEITMKKLASKIKDIAGIKGILTCDVSKPDGIPRRKLDSSKIFEMGWKPKVKLDEGLMRTFEWYKKMGQ
ncbi:GDP-L-fucose synthase family protein [bacterium]